MIAATSAGASREQRGPFARREMAGAEQQAPRPAGPPPRDHSLAGDGHRASDVWRAGAGAGSWRARASEPARTSG